MKKSGLADSPFFATPPEKIEAAPPSAAPQVVEEKEKPESKKTVRKSPQSSNRDTTIPRRYH